MIPEGIRVGPHRISVIFDEAAMDSQSVKSQTDLLGQYQAKTNTIWIRPSAHPDQIRDTLLHEVLHAVLSVHGLGQQLEDELEETIVRALAPALLDLFQRNVDLVAYLLLDDIEIIPEPT